MRRRQVRRDGVSAGLGLRRALLEELRAAPADAFDFLECAPDNWIGVGGRLGEALDELSARYPLSCHGLSLSLGGIEPLDETFLARTRRFLDRHRVALYSEHLSYCTGDGHLYDLMPIPFTAEAVRHVATRIVRVQDVLGRRIAVENVSYYAAHPPGGDGQDLDEAQFIQAVLEEADCDLLLDVNNVYVNAVNHGYDARAFLARMPSRRIVSCHVAGHYDEAVRHVAARIDRVQDVLGRRIAVENVSYYAAHPAAGDGQDLDEAQFVEAVLEEADCDLLLDVNNVYVNAINHGYDAHAFLARMPGRRIASYHVAGHYDQAEDLKIDTHGAPVKADVWDLLAEAYRLHGVRPTLLERDFNLPPLAELRVEVARIRELQRATMAMPATPAAGSAHG